MAIKGKGSKDGDVRASLLRPLDGSPEGVECFIQFIAKIAEVSSPDALLVLTTGDIGSRLARMRGQKWRLIHPPSHLHYFDRVTVTRLLAKTLGLPAPGETRGGFDG